LPSTAFGSIDGDKNSYSGMKSRSLRFLLRDQTQSQHTILDESIGPIDTVASYRAYVRGLAGFRAAVEPTIAECGEQFDSYSPTLVYPAAVADLNDLGLQPVKNLPGIKAPLSRAEALGALYVIEGSTLGARLIYGRAQRLGYNAHWGAQHLHVQTATERSWSKFVTLLDSASDNVQAEAVAAARRMFSIAIDAFQAARA
jgi:heme oxygenase (biliverdin-IX-beta and delta-forming)